MKQYLLETFLYNGYANKLALRKMEELPDQTECIRFFSHLINSMNKWLARIEQTPGYAELDWWEPVYPFDELSERWDGCLDRWTAFIETKTDEELASEVQWFNPDAGPGSYDLPNFAAAIKDIALQLNYHSIHHRAQIQYLIRQQGVEPQFVDYIGTRYRRLDGARGSAE
jgi:uncharacterized damage-inducible protein DinB